jgi:hypothetical protein
MRVPGRAWLEMRAEPTDDGGSVYRQRAVFFPRGLGGRLYWFSILPFHGVIFTGMANRITAAAESEAAAETAVATGRPSAPGEDRAPAEAALI